MKCFPSTERRRGVAFIGKVGARDEKRCEKKEEAPNFSRFPTRGQSTTVIKRSKGRGKRIPGIGREGADEKVRV